MKMIEQFLAQLDAETPRTRRVLENSPEGRDDWKPHPKSMPLGRLAMLVATMPQWFVLVLQKNELDLNPPGGGSNINQTPLKTNADLVRAFDENVAAAKKAFNEATEDVLMKPWRLLFSGRVVNEDLRHAVVRDTFTHLAHHRGQMTVYLRLNERPVPSVYGPTADDQQFR